MPTVSFGTFSKRRNSTKQPSGLSDTRNVKLKDLTSVDSPTFILTGNDFTYNYADWEGRYYFITDIRSMHNNLIEVDCILDVLATYKSEILASTQYVCYSSLHGGAWLADTRLVVQKDATVSRNIITLPFIDANGCYILSVVGQSGVDVFRVTRSTIQNLIEGLQDWRDNLGQDIKTTFDFSDDLAAYESIANALTDTGLIGNAYETAVQCIRSCHWVPFSDLVVGGTLSNIYLGNYPAKNQGTLLSGYKLSGTFDSGNEPIAIPWQYNDYRRAYCESVYLYLPFVGMVNIATDEIVGSSSLYVKYSITPSDGQVCYEVSADNQIIGTYGGNCKMDIPIGINQKSSLGDIATTMFAGAEKTINSAIHSSVSPVSASAATVGVGLGIASSTYEVGNVTASTHMSCIGGIGGGAGAGLTRNVVCFTVAHSTSCTPSAMQATMGLPTMKPVQLSSLSGFCQCANAHVDAPAMAHELDAIDSFLNSGFYIE